MVHIDLPAALPGIVTGLRLAVNTSLLVGITSEMLLSTNGLGSFLMRSQESFKIGAGLAGILVIAITVLLVNIGLRKIEERFFFWHYRTGVNR
jgi:ABC-type nitrate/sulfonate/bicarbonate transport system permease component